MEGVDVVMNNKAPQVPEHGRIYERQPGLCFCFACNFCDIYTSDRSTIIEHIENVHKFTIGDIRIIEHFSACYKPEDYDQKPSDLMFPMSSHSQPSASYISRMTVPVSCSSTSTFAVPVSKAGPGLPAQPGSRPGMPDQTVRRRGLPAQTVRRSDDVPTQTVKRPAVPAQTVERPAVPAQTVKRPAVPAQTVKTPAGPAQTVKTPAVPAQTVKRPGLPAQPGNKAEPAEPSSKAAPASDNFRPDISVNTGFVSGDLKIYYSCNYCEKYYTTVSNVRKHVRRAHKFESVSSEHYEESLREAKRDRIKILEGVEKVRSKGFVIPRKPQSSSLDGMWQKYLNSNQGNVGDPGQGDGAQSQGVGHVQLDWQYQEAEHGLEASEGGTGTASQGPMPVHGPVAAHGPVPVATQGPVPVAAIGPVPVTGHGPAPVAKKQTTFKKREKKDKVVKKKVPYYDGLVNVLLDPNMNKKLHIWKSGSKQKSHEVATVIVSDSAPLTPHGSVATDGVKATQEQTTTRQMCIELAPVPPRNEEDQAGSKVHFGGDLAAANSITVGLKSPEVVSLIAQQQVCRDTTDHEKKDRVKRGRRGACKIGQGRRQKKCSLIGCVPCSYEEDCQSCHECLNKRTLK